MEKSLVEDGARVLVSCCLSLLLLETTLWSTKSAEGGGANLGALITAVQFATVAVISSVKLLRAGPGAQSRPSAPPVPLCGLLLLFFWSSLLTNLAYDFGVPVPVHGLIKSGSLAATVLCGFLLRGRRYSRANLMAVGSLTVGVGLCSAAVIFEGRQELEFDGRKALGISMLVVSLILGALTGLVQEHLYRERGCRFEDVLFLSHALPLPLLLWNGAVAEGWNAVLGSRDPRIPALSLVLCGVAQYGCVTNVSAFASRRSPFAVTFVLTLRKFVSIVLSVIFFDASFGWVHWIGAIFVFVGTVLFEDDAKKKR